MEVRSKQNRDSSWSVTYGFLEHAMMVRIKRCVYDRAMSNPGRIRVSGIEGPCTVVFVKRNLPHDGEWDANVIDI